MSASAPVGPILARAKQNAFLVLGLAIDADLTEAEREGQKLLSMLKLGLESAARIDTPVGPLTRTESDVLEALRQLRDPEKLARARSDAELMLRLAAIPFSMPRRPRPVVSVYRALGIAPPRRD